MAKQKKLKQSNKQWLVIGTALGLIALFIVVFAWPFGSTVQASVQNVSVTDLANAQGDYVIIDVREQWEYDEGHVPGVTLIPLGELESRISEIPSNKPVYVICRSGNRSTTASNILLKAGLGDIRNVQGGTLAWQQAGLAIEQ